IIENLDCGEWFYYKIWVIESFSLYPWKARALSFNECLPAQIIGAIKFYTYKKDLDLIFQNAGLVKGAITDEFLKRVSMNWTEKLKNKHERDAAKHALYYLIRKGRWINYVRTN
ncbi:MAG: hypothetical protein Q8M94_09900, partial [Ignavibacteria bacterium]|nr:hypothetical protein [Ignavibacteria bacterium]